jgi:ADP-ribose pyrophosphatase YjhB (NUDIX family)
MGRCCRRQVLEKTGLRLTYGQLCLYFDRDLWDSRPVVMSKVKSTAKIKFELLLAFLV